MKPIPQCPGKPAVLGDWGGPGCPGGIQPSWQGSLHAAQGQCQAGSGARPGARGTGHAEAPAEPSGVYVTAGAAARAGRPISIQNAQRRSQTTALAPEHGEAVGRAAGGCPVAQEGTRAQSLALPQPSSGARHRGCSGHGAGACPVPPCPMPTLGSALGAQITCRHGNTQTRATGKSLLCHRDG